MTALHDDPGLQPERTALSWTRTVLALMVCSATLLRWAPKYPGILLVVIVLMAALSGVIAVGQRRRYRKEAEGLAQDKVPPNIIGVLTLTACIAGFAVAEIIVVGWFDG